MAVLDDPAWVSQGPPLRPRVLSVVLLLLWAAMGANLSWRKGTYGQCIDWIGTTFSGPPTPRFQCSVNRNPSTQSRRTPGLYGKTFAQKRTGGRPAPAIVPRELLLRILSVQIMWSARQSQDGSVSAVPLSSRMRSQLRAMQLTRAKAMTVLLRIQQFGLTGALLAPDLFATATGSGHVAGQQGSLLCQWARSVRLGNWSWAHPDVRCCR